MIDNVVVTPLMALGTDAFGTLMTQAGYVFMKWSQIDKENMPENKRHDMSQSPFCTFNWVFGFLLVLVGCVVHAGKFAQIRLFIISL